MMVVKRQWLLAIGRIFGMVEVELKRAWRTGKASDDLLDQGLTNAINILVSLLTLGQYNACGPTHDGAVDKLVLVEKRITDL